MLTDYEANTSCPVIIWDSRVIQITPMIRGLILELIWHDVRSACAEPESGNYYYHKGAASGCRSGVREALADQGYYYSSYLNYAVDRLRYNGQIVQWAQHRWGESLDRQRSMNDEGQD